MPINADEFMRNLMKHGVRGGVHHSPDRKLPFRAMAVKAGLVDKHLDGRSVEDACTRLWAIIEHRITHRASQDESDRAGRQEVEQ